VNAVDLKTGALKWRAFATGPDSEIRLAKNFNEHNPHYGVWSGLLCCGDDARCGGPV
jgi:hypothetical protein